MLRVKKRDGRLEKVQFEKVTNRIRFLAQGVLRDGTKIGEALNNVSCETVAKDVISKLADGITTTELDEYAAKFCASLAPEDHEYTILGGRISVSNHQKNTINSFTETTRLLYENKLPTTGEPYPLLKREYYKFVMRYSRELERIIDYTRDFLLDYFGFETLKKSYFLRRQDTIGLNVVETPQHMYMRVAVGLTLPFQNILDNKEIMELVKETYDKISQGEYSHASPTMYNTGTHTEQLSSCYLLGVGDSMVEDGGIPDCWKACALISKGAGGIGIALQTIRAAGTLIAGTGGNSDGIVPMIRVFNDIARYVNQGGRRPGAIKMSITPWHADIYDFLDLKKNIGIEERRARDLTYALWVPDIFMRRLEQAFKEKRKVVWSLMCPHQSPGLVDIYGEEFEELYERYEAEGQYIKQVDIRHLWKEIRTSQNETGGPDFLFSDHINRKSNQKNLGVIKNSNLCSEIVEYSSDQEYAVCNLASVSLVKHVMTDDEGKKKLDCHKLIKTCMTAHRNLDSVIDINAYPHEKCRLSNLRHRPVALGTQAFHDMLLELGLSYDLLVDKSSVTKINPETREINKLYAECMYYGSVKSTIELAKQRHEPMKRLHQLYVEGKLKFKTNGLDLEYISPEVSETDLELIKNYHPIQDELNRESYWGSYSSYIGSPLSEGKMQHDLWDVIPITLKGENSYGLTLDWASLYADLAKYGARNSLLRADMPTASTAQILGNSECTEPYKYAVYTRRVTAGEYVVVNPYLHKELQKLNMWTPEVKHEITKLRGSVQKLNGVPQWFKDRFRTAYEVSPKTYQILAAERGAFIDQTQSMNYFIPHPNDKLMTNVLLGGWRLGLKTGMYYLRREPVVNPIQFTVDGGFKVNSDKKEEPSPGCAGGCSA